MHRWEKWPVAALFIAQGLYVMEWYAGTRLAIPVWLMAWIATFGGLAAFVAIDGAMVATVAGMRAGRRGRWSVAAIVVTALFGALVALSLHGALPAWFDAWLHAGFAATITTYLLHLAQPIVTPANLAADLASTRAELATARDTIATLRDTVAAERSRPVLRLEDATRLLVEAGAPEATIRGWMTSGRLRLADAQKGASDDGAQR